MGGFFRFSDAGTNLRTEVIAGPHDLMTMAYIIFVQPQHPRHRKEPVSRYPAVLRDLRRGCGGEHRHGPLRELPVALASVLGLTRSWLYLDPGLQLPWQTAMAAVIVEGLLVTILVLTNLREAVLNPSHSV